MVRLYIILMHISCFIGFFANDISCCVFYVYFRLGKLFFFEFKMGCKAGETTLNINNAFSPGTANEHTGQWWFKKCCKSCKCHKKDSSDSLEEEEHGGWPSEFDNDQLRGSLKLILLQLHEKLPKNSMLTILWLFSIWSKLERWKSSVSWCLMSRLQIKKKLLFWSVIFSYSRQQQQTIFWSDFDI